MQVPFFDLTTKQGRLLLHQRYCGKEVARHPSPHLQSGSRYGPSIALPKKQGSSSSTYIILLQSICRGGGLTITWILAILFALRGQKNLCYTGSRNVNRPKEHGNGGFTFWMSWSRPVMPKVLGKCLPGNMASSLIESLVSSISTTTYGWLYRLLFCGYSGQSRTTWSSTTWSGLRTNFSIAFGLGWWTTAGWTGTACMPKAGSMRASFAV